MARTTKKPAHDVILQRLKEVLEILSRYEQMESPAYQAQNRMGIERAADLLMQILREMVIPDDRRDAIIQRLREMKGVDKKRDWESFDADKKIDETIRSLE
jgi:phosphoenolpyruvate synthase/pyruvate phosphate dikinase